VGATSALPIATTVKLPLGYCSQESAISPAILLNIIDELDWQGADHEPDIPNRQSKYHALRQSVGQPLARKQQFADGQLNAPIGEQWTVTII
jgi:hypothetical protein